jgi:hypothetical protein
MMRQARLAMGVNDIKALLTPEHMSNFSKYCIVPRTPDAVLSPDNAIVVTTAQRRFAVESWKSGAAAYRAALDLVT